MKTIIITGASRGIGLATAKKFLEEGWKVIGTSRNGRISLDSSNMHSVALELANSQSVSHAAQMILKISPHFDVLLNNAALLVDGHTRGIDIQKLNTTLDVNLINTINFTEVLLPAITKNGHIINISSGYGAMSYPLDDDASHSYRISKAALNMYTRILAFRLKNSGITASSLDPGWVRTDMGYSVASETEKPDRGPEQAADDIYNLVFTAKETGCFWRFGQKREW